MLLKTSVLTLSLLGSLVALPTSASAAVDVDLVVRIPPPAVRYEAVPPPRVGYVWTPGYWDWRSNHHVWVTGTWVRSRPGYVYTRPQWVERNGQWHLARGSWARHDGDHDGVPNYRDRDRDNDGKPNWADKHPYNGNR